MGPPGTCLGTTALDREEQLNYTLLQNLHVALLSFSINFLKNALFLKKKIPDNIALSLMTDDYRPWLLIPGTRFEVLEYKALKFISFEYIYIYIYIYISVASGDFLTGCAEC